MITWLALGPIDYTHAKLALVAWTSALGSPQPLPGYGTQPGDVDLVFGNWTARNGMLLHAFATWWNPSHSLKVPEGVGNPAQAELTEAHIKALDQWALEAGQKVTPPALDYAASKSLLVLWGKTDGVGLVVSDYGLQPADFSAWGPRDDAALAAFSKWRGGGLPTTGSLTAEHAVALKQWLIERMAKVPGGFQSPPATPPAQKTPQPPPKPLPEPGKTAPAPPAALVDKPKDNTALYVLGGLLVAVIGGLWFWMARTPRAVVSPSQDNPAKRPAKRKPTTKTPTSTPRDLVPRAPRDPVLPTEIGTSWIAVTQEQPDGRWAAFLVDTQSESWRREGSGSVIGSHGRPVYEIANDANTALKKLEQRAGRTLSELFANPRTR